MEANLLLRHPADARSYGLATAMLVDLGVKDIRLLTNNPDKVRAVEGPNREIAMKERVAMIPLAWRGIKGGIRSEEVGGYLKTKVIFCPSECGVIANGMTDREIWVICYRWVKIRENQTFEVARARVEIPIASRSARK